MANIRMDQDSKGHEYAEIELRQGEWLRLTHIPGSWMGQPGYRLQIKVDGKPPRPGPEFPTEMLGDLVRAALKLPR